LCQKVQAIVAKVLQVEALYFNKSEH